MSNSAVKKSYTHKYQKIKSNQQNNHITYLKNSQTQKGDQRPNKQSLFKSKQKKSYQNIFLPSENSSPTMNNNKNSHRPNSQTSLIVSQLKNKKSQQLINNQTSHFNNQFDKKTLATQTRKKLILQQPNQLFSKFRRQQEYIQPTENNNQSIVSQLVQIKAGKQNNPFKKQKDQNQTAQNSSINRSSNIYQASNMNNQFSFKNIQNSNKQFFSSQNSKKEHSNSKDALNKGQSILPKNSSNNDNIYHVNEKNFIGQEDYGFGQGLQPITKRQNQTKELLQKVNKNSLLTKSRQNNQLNKNLDLYSTFPLQKQHLTQYSPFHNQGINYHPQSTTFSPQPSSMSINKKRINKLIDKVQKRQSSKNFYKRPLSATYSQDYKSPFMSQKQNQKISNHTKQNQSDSGAPTNRKRHEKNTSDTIKARKISVQTKNSLNLRNLKQNQINNAQNFSRNQGLNGTYNAFHQTLTRRNQLQLSIANNITRLLFKYNGGHATTLYNYRLKVKNQSPVSVCVKIKCTSPSHYVFRPSTSIQLLPTQIVNFSIQLKLYAHDLNPLTMKHDLSRYKNDKFKICYQASSIHPDIQYEQGQKILPIVIQQTQQQKIRNEGIIKNLKNQQQKVATQQKQIKIYKTMIQKNNKIMEELQGKIKCLNQKSFYSGYFTKGLFVTSIILGMGLGFWLG